MTRKEMVDRARSAFREVLEAMEQPKAQLLQRDPAIKELVENIVRHVESAKQPEHWPVEEFPDRYAKIHPQDSRYWSWLLTQAAFQSKELADILCWFRGTGCTLEKNPQYGYCIRPVIGSDGWESMDVYNKEKTALQGHAALLLKLLKALADTEKSGKLIPERDLTQDTLKKQR